MWPFTRKKKKPEPYRPSSGVSSSSSPSNNDLTMFSLGMMAGDSSPREKPSSHDTPHHHDHSSHHDSGAYDSGSYDSGSSDSGGGSDGGGGGGGD